jgi:hypothetical protein
MMKAEPAVVRDRVERGGGAHGSPIGPLLGRRESATVSPASRPAEPAGVERRAAP